MLVDWTVLVLLEWTDCGYPKMVVGGRMDGAWSMECVATEEILRGPGGRSKLVFRFLLSLKTELFPLLFDSIS